MQQSLEERWQQGETLARTTLAGALSSPSQVASAFTVRRREQLSNTFLNFVDTHVVGMRRTKSLNLGSLRSVSTDPDSEDDAEEKRLGLAGAVSQREMKMQVPPHHQPQPTLGQHFRQHAQPPLMAPAPLKDQDGGGCKANPRGGADEIPDQDEDPEAASPDASASTASASEATSSVQTTVVVSNLPRGFVKQELMDAMDNRGFAGTYDYLHVPFSLASGVCLGYAFVNFKTNEAAQTFSNLWQGARVFCDRKHKKPLAVTWARVQGLAAHMAQPATKKHLRVRNLALRPFVDLSSS
eukprot:CAMPEP_0178438636 /NCGR_PEP_ID=MMETSP0689_2-20121128/35702_1 /TAXON_ID=160604 /ORGANISM="Amphidinium massartii, Strain CS-259" /LENGTH=296 /DNA_ID=CAMNT_0020061059 /DNA_START=42 /DNA_END=932 /DNA_ORIENTATION=-